MARAEAINPGFSIADAERPALTFRGGDLFIEFLDCREQIVRLRFHNVCVLRWHEIDRLLLGEPYDGACIIHESDWLAEHLKQDAIPRDAGHQHFRFNFNACGQLEVICTSFNSDSPTA